MDETLLAILAGMDKELDEIKEKLEEIEKKVNQICLVQTKDGKLGVLLEEKQNKAKVRFYTSMPYEMWISKEEIEWRDNNA